VKHKSFVETAEIVPK